MEGYTDFDQFPTLITTGYDTVWLSSIIMHELTIFFGPGPGVARGHFQDSHFNAANIYCYPLRTITGLYCMRDMIPASQQRRGEPVWNVQNKWSSLWNEKTNTARLPSFCRGHATYKSPCRSVGPSVGPSVRRSVGHTLLFLRFWALWE